MKTLILYAAFAALAILVNLLSQEASLRVYQGSLSLYVAILVGTGTGLVTKYLLDKFYIFNDRASGWGHHAGRFVAYSLTGVVTTLIFWGFELGFELLFNTRTARYTGAVTGLTLGYLLKYQLDKRFVFRHRAAL